ncbi:MAG TPA: glycine cleavage T C-terminal barrel domain-containing protein [Microbacterium sp.]|nr:glycine cleavage T C-terminal barrel domain-containing protein [Microbacterium sp.]
MLGPTADRPIAMGYVATAYSEPGTPLTVTVDRGSLRARSEGEIPEAG